ncbi:helix-turn-helix transcriptional regulator [Thermus thalpophilus]|uniref:helix-turn-helix transcriptional regulator n=1 Tax=Thermus thalpophilus TaxID=2908147 RepID=UPI001FAB1A34|nr:response regulator transcription factor [Thermus thalpophilus]
MIRVWLQFPSLALKEAVAEALKAEGLEAAPHPLGAQVALVLVEREVPPPPPLPSLALLRENDQAPQTLKRGYRGYLYPDQGLDVLVKALKAVAQGEVWAERRKVAEALEEPPPHLTLREKEVAALAALGLSNKEIAKELGISEKTVKAHLTLVFQKLGIKRRSELTHVRFLS